jgi:GrpB-like predicted nucleotidyltransferase (UPF0157 family)
MSLCVAWKFEHRGVCQVFLAADSCAVLLRDVMPYGGIKVLEIPICIISHGPNPGVLFKATYGMAFAGSYLAAFLLKELVAEVLSNIQFLAPVEAISFERICGLVFLFHRHFHNTIKKQLKAHNEIDFFFSGYCPSSKTIRVAKFYVDPTTFDLKYGEILAGDGFSFDTLGDPDAQRRYAELLNLNLSVPPCRTQFASFRRLWDIINDPTYPNVAGAVQYGEFSGTDFRRVGAFDVRLKGQQLASRTFICGTDTDEVYNPIGKDDFYITYTFGNPFSDDIQSFDANSFWEDDGTRHAVDEQITIVPHSPQWLRWFEEEQGFLQMIVGKSFPIEHIGSTAVSKLPAVPIVDIAIGVDTIGDGRHPPFNFELLRYEFLGDKMCNGQLLYRKRGAKSFNLHIIPRPSQKWRNCLAFREHLRSDVPAQEAYSKARLGILNNGSWTLVRYLSAKSGYIETVLERIHQGARAPL